MERSYFNQKKVYASSSRKLKKKSDGGRVLTEAEIIDYLGIEYGYTKEDIFKLSSREISEIIEAMYYRKLGKEKVVVEVDEDMDKKIMNMAPKNFKERRNGKQS